MSNSSSAIQSWVGGRSQHVIGGLLGIAGALHFFLWTQGSAGSTFLTTLQSGQLSEAIRYAQTYLASHPAYPLFLVLGIIIVVRASRS